MSHRVVVDLQAAQSVAHGDRGVARYSIELTRALIRRGADIAAITCNPNLPEPARLPEDLTGSGRLRWATAREFADQRSRGPIAYQVMSPMELALPAPLVLSRAGMARSDALIVVLYDLIPLIFAERYLIEPQLREPYLARLQLIRDADLVLAISECTRLDGLSRLGLHPDRVVTIGGGAARSFRRPAIGDDPRAAVRSKRPDIGRSFVLTVAGYEWRKNTEALIEAYAALPATVRGDRQLVIACAVPPEAVAVWREHGRRCGLADSDLVMTGYVDDQTLVHLYQAAELFVFPSLYEGFGLPVLEAAQCGAPVITSNTSSLPEILRLPVSTFDAADVASITASMQRGLTDEFFRSQLRGAGERAAQDHSWEAVADRTIAAYERLATIPPRRPVRIRPRVAIVGPLPPVQSGVALYNERVLAALDHHGLDVHLFHESPRGVGHPRPPIDVPCYPVEALGSRLDPHDYDTVLYTVGNGGAHVRTFDLARRVPGVVWLHDVDLVGLHLEWALWRIREGSGDSGVLSVFRDEILDMYEGRVDPAPLLVEPLSHVSFSAAEVGLSAGLVRRSRRVVVNSAHARQRLERDLAGGSVDVPLHVVPHAVPGPSQLPIPAMTGNRSRPLVVALGVVHEIKRPDVLIDAVALLDVDVAFVGPCEAGLTEYLRDRARSAGIEDRLTITGFVDVATYAHWIGEAAVVVLLRNVTFGESSGAVHDAIAGRKPIVSSIASVSELPEGIVHSVAIDADRETIAGAISTAIASPGTASPGTASPVRNAAADDYAKAWSFKRVADEILTVVLTDVTSR